MIWHAKTNGKQKKLIDCMGKEILYVRQFDDITKEAMLFLSAGGKSVVVSEGKALLTKITIPDAKIIDRE